MKKILAISALAALLAACSDAGDRPGEPLQGPPHGNNPQLEQAMQECHSATVKGENKPGTVDEAAFRACMKQKGFKKPENKGPAPSQMPNTVQ